MGRNFRLHRKIAVWLIVLFVAGAGAGAGTLWRWKERPAEGSPATIEDAEPSVAAAVRERYDVIVVGTDPEGVAAAVSAARNGLRTLLIDGRGRRILGGLFTLGWLNSLDMNRAPGSQTKFLNGGIFGEWFKQVEGDSFDVTTAAIAFKKMVQAEKNLDVLLGLKRIEPLAERARSRIRVTGVRLVLPDGTPLSVRAPTVIDATQDADIAALAGAEFTLGREDIGDPHSLMAVTLVFKLGRVTDAVWSAIRSRLNGDDDPMTGANRVSAWGYRDMWQYESSRPDKLRMRGLNIGRQNDGTALVNAIQLFGVDGLDPASRMEADRLVKSELPRLFAELQRRYPEFREVTLGGVAPELYVRETRHLIGEYRLSIVDLLEQRDHWDRIAFGSYEVDIQSTSPNNTGWVMMRPQQYAIPFRCLVPRGVDGLLVVGRSASFDSLPHGSARVVTVGMATGQAAGAAARIARDAGMTFRELAASREHIRRLQQRLQRQGMDLRPIRLPKPAYMKHYAYEGLKEAARLAIVSGNYTNDFQLDAPSNPLRFARQLAQAARIHKASFPGELPGADRVAALQADVPLSLNDAARALAAAAGLEEAAGSLGREAPSSPSDPVAALLEAGLLNDRTLALIKDRQKLTNGEVYLLLRDVIQALKQAS